LFHLIKIPLEVLEVRLIHRNNMLRGDLHRPEWLIAHSFFLDFMEGEGKDFSFPGLPEAISLVSPLCFRIAFPP